MSSRVTRSLNPFDFDLGQPGVIPARSADLGLTAAAATANRCYYSRFTVAQPTVAALGAVITTTASGTDDECAFAIYNGTTLARLATSGAVTGKMNAAAGVQTIPLTASLALSPGTVYYAAFSYGASAGPATLLSANAGATGPNLTSIFGASAPKFLWAFEASAHVPPATATPSVGTITAFPIVAVRES